jgi:hypothetical protein
MWRWLPAEYSNDRWASGYIVDSSAVNWHFLRKNRRAGGFRKKTSETTLDI